MVSTSSQTSLSLGNRITPAEYFAKYRDNAGGADNGTKRRLVFSEEDINRAVANARGIQAPRKPSLIIESSDDEVSEGSDYTYRPSDELTSTDGASSNGTSIPSMSNEELNRRQKKRIKMLNKQAEKEISAAVNQAFYAILAEPGFATDLCRAGKVQSWAEESAQKYMKSKIEAWNDQVKQLNQDVAKYRTAAETATYRYAAMETQLKTAESRFEQRMDHSPVLLKICSYRLIEVLSMVSEHTLAQTIAAIQPFGTCGLPVTKVKVDEITLRLLTDKNEDDPFLFLELRDLTRQFIHRELQGTADRAWREADKVSVYYINRFLYHIFSCYQMASAHGRLGA